MRVRTSKALSYLLRHAALKEALPIRDDGYISVTEVLAHKSMRNVELELIREIVATCPKQRYRLNEENGILLIRANQGHSIEIKELELTPILEAAQVPCAVHGTYYKHLESIKKSGLMKMNRQHIHMAAGVPGEKTVISGARANVDIFIHLDIDKALRAGIPFFLSANRVVLSPGDESGSIRPEFFAKIVDAKTGEVLPL